MSQPRLLGAVGVLISFNEMRDRHRAHPRSIAKTPAAGTMPGPLVLVGYVMAEGSVLEPQNLAVMDRDKLIAVVVEPINLTVLD